MNAIREYFDGSDGTITLTIPKEYQKMRLEVIILPAENQNSDSELLKTMQRIGLKAKSVGLTQKKLDALLND
jgi:hypothetical protein